MKKIIKNEGSPVKNKTLQQAKKTKSYVRLFIKSKSTKGEDCGM